MHPNLVVRASLRRRVQAMVARNLRRGWAIGEKTMMNVIAAVLGIALLGAATYAAAWQLHTHSAHGSCEQMPA